MDEVPLLFDLTPDTTLEIKGSKEVAIRVTSKYKMRATLVLCCFADGTKMPPFIIFKEATGELPKKLKDVYDPKKVVLKGNRKGWMNTELMNKWVEEVWIPNICKETSYLLIWDAFSAHKDETLIENLLVNHDTSVQIIPGGCTSVLQPLDVGINRPLKERIRQDFQNWAADKMMNPTSTSFRLISCFINIFRKN